MAGFAANISTWLLPLLGQSSRFEHLGRRFRPGGSTFEPNHVLIGMVLVGAFIAVLWMLQRYYELRAGRGYVSRWGLFRELCKAHRLSWSDRLLLGKLAKVQGVDQPARLFLEPQRLDPATLSPSLAGKMRQVTILRQRLFGDLDAVSQK